MLDLRMKPDGLCDDLRNVRKTGRAPLRVAFLSYRSDPRVGGQGVYVDYLSNALVKAGAAVDVISGPPYPDLSPGVRLVKLPSLDLYAQPHNGHFALRPRHLLSPVDIYEYFGHLSGKFVEPYTFGQRALAYLRHTQGQYDIIFDNQSLSSGMLKAARGLKLPIAAMIHHPITQDRRLAIEAAPNQSHRMLVRRWYSFHHMQIKVARRIAHITCPSEHAKADIAAEFEVDPGRIHPIPIGVDQSAFCPAPGATRNRYRIVTTASADTPLKGLHILIEAYQRILATTPEAELVVIGTLRNGLARNTLRDLGLEERVQFKSDLSREQMAQEFRTAWVAVTPSFYEGFGLPAAEAMSCGTPVVVTDGGALPEVAGSAGIIVPKGDPEALAAAIGRLLKDPSHHAEVAAACRARAEARFNWNRIAPHYLDFFEQAMAAPC